MESSKSLQVLIERAWALHDRVSDQIHKDSMINFCRLCSQQGRHCEIAETIPLEERERLISIRDALKDIKNMLAVLHRSKSWQERNENTALARLEESRLVLMDKVAQYKGKSLDVIQEFDACFGDGRSAYRPCLGMTMGKNDDEDDGGLTERRSYGFIICCIRSFINPWHWHNTARAAMKLILISATIFSTFNFNQSAVESANSPRKFLSILESRMAGNLDVSHGRG